MSTSMTALTLVGELKSTILQLHVSMLPAIFAEQVGYTGNAFARIQIGMASMLDTIRCLLRPAPSLMECRA